MFNIQKFCTHDGPGIRTVVFLKGCPLKCQWCSNPESQDLMPNILFDERKCIGCGFCIKACPKNIPIGQQEISPLCTKCGLCAKVCPTKALEIMGETAVLDEILEEVEKDESYYVNGGGVTISGGEPLMHSTFVCELADGIKKSGYHLAIETTGFAQWEIAEKVFSKFDLILFDIKHMDDEKHLQYTGVSNKIILENAKKAAQKGFSLLIRVPLLGGINDDEENINALADFCVEAGIYKVEFLPYHKFGESKYAMMHKEYICNATTPSLAHRQMLGNLLTKKGIDVIVGH